ncbi:hypothetical protein HKD37_05G013152 [Glycine soja]
MLFVVMWSYRSGKKEVAKCQEVARKNVERAFGVLKSHFERDTYNGNVDVDYDHIDEEIPNIDVSRGAYLDFVAYLQTRHYMHTRGVHQQLQPDLVEHIWKHFDHNNDEI